MVINHLQVLGARPPSTKRWSLQIGSDGLLGDWLLSSRLLRGSGSSPRLTTMSGGVQHRVFAEKYHDHRCRMKIETESSVIKRVNIFSRVSMYEVNLLHLLNLFLGQKGFKRMFVANFGNHIRDNSNDLPHQSVNSRLVSSHDPVPIVDIRLYTCTDMLNRRYRYIEL